VAWPADKGAGCLSNFIETSEYNDMLISTTRVSLDSTYSPAYFKVARAFVGMDVEDSFLSIRVFNVILGSLFFLTALVVSTRPIKRALALSWGLAIIPVGIFFLASVNPSSWLIFSIGTYWAFLATGLAHGISRRQRIFAWLGALSSVAVALSSRTDAIIYLVIISVAILVFRWREIAHQLNKVTLLALLALSALISIIGSWIFFNRFTVPNFSWGSDIPSGGLPAPLKTLSELPAFFFGLFGGQGSYSEIKTGLDDVPGARTSGFVYGLGWVEFNLPSFVGIIGATSTLIVIFLILRKISIHKTVTLLILIISFAAVILALRANIDFQNFNHVQPRYLFPLLLAAVGIALISSIKRRPLLSRTQASLLVIALTFSGSIAWLATASRYAIGPSALITDFGQPYEWWWHIGPGRLGWFVFTAFVTGVWVFSTVWVWGRVQRSNRKPQDSLQEAV
jgi:hypothetical protein